MNETRLLVSEMLYVGRILQMGYPQHVEYMHFAALRVGIWKPVLLAWSNPGGYDSFV